MLVPRLARFMTESEPDFDDIDMRGWDVARGYRDARAAEVLATLSAARRAAVRDLEWLGPDRWHRLGMHSTRGPYTLADMVRYWVEHDLSHRRQIDGALRG